KKVSNYKISKDTGIRQSTLSDYATGKSDIGNMKLDHAEMLNKYYKEEVEMKEIIKDYLAGKVKLDQEYDFHEIEYTDGKDVYIIHHVDGTDVQLLFPETPEKEEFRIELESASEEQKDEMLANYPFNELS